VARNSNVYAELGSTWHCNMRDPDSATHIIGKLVKHIGGKNVLYGSDCIWYGSPQDQIQALGTFQISDKFQDKYGYAKITPELSACIFGLNAADVYNVELDEVLRTAQSDPIARRCEAYRENPDPHFQTLGPKTRREFIANLKCGAGRLSRRRHWATKPPSTGIAMPVAKGDASEHSQRIASPISSGFPIRPAGTRWVIDCMI